MNKDEEILVSSNLLKQWGFDEGCYWEPLEKKSPTKVNYIAYEIFKKYEDKIVKILRENDFIYIFGESGRCKISSNELKAACVMESALCPPNFESIIYLSHEDTVAFGGTIAGEIMKLLAEDIKFINVWTTEPVSTSNQRTSKSVPKRGITPMREPCSGSKSNAGPPAMARSISRVIGKSRNSEYFSVTAKSCIKTGFSIVIGVVWISSPSALMTE